MTNQNNAAQTANPEIRAAFELCYAVDANDPAIVTDLGHFTNGWRACVMSQVRAPVADERSALQKLVDLEDMRLRLRNLHERGHGTDYDHYYKALDAAWAAARAALKNAPAANPAATIHQHGFAGDNQRLRAINESLDKQLEEVMTERDDRTDTIDKLLDLVQGKDRPEWSSAYDYGDALIQVEDHMHALSVRASAPVAGEAQKGWRLVPEKLTEEMRTAGDVVRSPSGTVSYGLSRHALALAWDALLSAAPSPPATHAAPQASEAQCSCPSGDGSLRWPCAKHRTHSENDS